MDEVVEALEKYQGLVPLVYDIETMGLDEARPEDMPYAVYLKREADKVIAEKNAEIAELKNKINESQTELELWSDGSIISEAHQKELDGKQHSDYKRCLAMAKWCDAEFYMLRRSALKDAFWLRWNERWLAIAEQFKEAK